MGSGGGWALAAWSEVAVGVRHGGRAPALNSGAARPMSVRPSPPSRPVGLGVVLLLQLACGGDAIITLGQGDPRPRFFDQGRAIAILNSPDDDENPTLTEDMLEIYFTSDRDGGPGESDVWFATRESRAEPFREPEPLIEASSEEDETSSAISADGLTLWVGSKRPLVAASGDDDDDEDSGHNIWRLRRANRESPWEQIEPVESLNSDSDDIPRPVALNGTVMPIASKRGNGDDYETLLATRSTIDEEFSPNLELIPEISEQGLYTVDAFMTNDGRLLFFNRSDDEDEGVLYMAWRRSPENPFIETLPLDVLNLGDDVRDPWVNKDGTRFFFTSDRGGGQGGLDIYLAFIELPSEADLAGR